MDQAKSGAIDESGLRKGELRKLRALRKSLGTEIADRAFAEWLSLRSAGPNEEDTNAGTIVDVLWPLVQEGKLNDSARRLPAQAGPRQDHRGGRALVNRPAAIPAGSGRCRRPKKSSTGDRAAHGACDVWNAETRLGPAGHRNAQDLAMRLLPLVAALIAATLVTISGAEAAEEFYLRAGIGLDRPADAAFMDEDCSSASPDALYGCGTGGDGAPRRSLGDFGTGGDGAPRRSLGDFGTVTGIELGLGLNAAPAVRIEALVDYRPRITFEGRAMGCPL